MITAQDQAANVVSTARYPALRKKLKVKRKKIPTLHHVAGVAPPTPVSPVRPTTASNFFPNAPPLIEEGNPNNRSKEESRCKYQIEPPLSVLVNENVPHFSFVALHHRELPKRPVHFG